MNTDRTPHPLLLELSLMNPLTVPAHLGFLCSAAVALLLGLVESGTAASPKGTPFGWGAYDPMSLPVNATNIVALDASLLGPIALRADGTVLTWDGSPQPPLGLSNVVAVSAGDVFHLALKGNGQVVAWGGFHVESVAITTPPAWLTNVVAISAGYDHSVALTSDGFLIPWGANALAVLQSPVRPFRPRSFSAGQQTVIVVDDNGKLSGWGADHSGVLTFPAALNDAIQVSVSPFMHALGLRSDGRVFAWGNNSDGQSTVPNGTTNVIQVAAGPLWSLALRDDGSVRIWGQINQPWTRLPEDPVRFFSVAAGNNRNFGLTRAPVARDVPSDTNVLAGTDLQLVRAFIGSDPFDVQWTFNGQPLPGETRPTLRLHDAQASAAGEYRLIASNAFGISTSTPFVVAVAPAPPRLVAEPASIGVTRGTEARFVVQAAGTAPLAYQWFFNEVPVPDGNRSTLSIPSAGLAVDGAYRVVVSNALGTVSSRTVRLSTGLPAFTAEPASFHGLQGRPIRLEGSVVTPETPSYTWWRGTHRIEDAGSPLLAIPRIEPRMTGEYRLVASNSFGAVTSRVAHVSIREPRRPLAEPMAAVYPSSLGLPYPEAFLRVTDAAFRSNGDESFAIGIRVDGTVVTWAASERFAERIAPPAGLSDVKAVSAAYQHALALRSDGSVVAWRNDDYQDRGLTLVPPTLNKVIEIAAGTEFNLALRDNGELVTWPYDTTFPVNLHGVAAVSMNGLLATSLREDGTVWIWDAFSPGSPAVTGPTDGIAIAAGGDFAAVLRRDGKILIVHRDGSTEEPIAPATGSAIAEITAFGQTVLARGIDGRVWASRPPARASWQPWDAGLSRAARLCGGIDAACALTDAPFIQKGPTPIEAEIRGTATLEVSASSTSAAAYQWLRDGVRIAGGTAQRLKLADIGYRDDALYSVIMANERASATSAPVRITVVGPPEIVGPDSRSAPAGSDLVLQPTVFGPGPFQFQWYFEERPLVGGTTTNLVLPNLQEATSGNYRVTVSNAFGLRWSATTMITALPSAPRILAAEPDTVSIPEGGPLRLALTARGSEPIQYQWWLDGRPVPGETNATLLRQTSTPADAGNWRLLASNTVGSMESLSIRVSVLPTAPRILQQESWRLANAGNPFEWKPTIAGSALLHRQWKRNGEVISGATNLSLAFTAIRTNDTGLYTLHLSNHLGVAVSDPMKLVVRPTAGPGAIVTWGQPTPPRDFGIVQDFAIGGNHAQAVLTNGMVRSWVNGTSPELVAPADLDQVVGIATGPGFAVALRSDGTLRGWGYPDGGVLNIPTGLGRVIAIAAGSRHAVALQENGIPVTWGTVIQGRTNTPASATNIIAISASSGNNLGLRGDGSVIAWGPNQAVAIPASVSNIIAISAFPRGGMALRADLRPIAWGTVPTPMASATNLTSIATGSGHAIALRTNGTMVAWGADTRGQTTIPLGLTNVLALFAGFDASAALTRSPVFAQPLAPSVVYARFGDQARLSPEVQGLGPMTFQWFANDRAIEGQTHSTLTLEPVSPALEASYTLRVSNPWQTVFSPPIRLVSFGPIEFRWVLSSSASPKLWIRAPGLSSVRLQESLDLENWSPFQTLAIPPEGAEFDIGHPLDRDSSFYRLLTP